MSPLRTLLIVGASLFAVACGGNPSSGPAPQGASSADITEADLLPAVAQDRR